MATVTVMKFEDVEGARTTYHKLGAMSKEHLLTIHDAAIVEWQEGKKRPKTQQVNDLVAAGGWSGAFWGLLFGVIFLVPILGMAVGAAMGALSGSLADIGIDDDFIAKIRLEVTEGTSALFLMTSDEVVDRIKAGLGDAEFEIIATNLSEEQEEALKAAFGDGED